MKPVPWQDNRRIPKAVRAVLAALQWRGAAAGSLESLTDAEWRQALDFCDRSQLTLVLGERCRGRIPERVEQRIARNLADNTERLSRIKDAYRDVAGALEAAGIGFVVLKGLAQWPEFVSDLRLRPQYDLDLYCPGETVFAAREALLKLGYEPLRQAEQLPTDHLPAMIRKTGWQWRGDYFDPEIPVSVDLHFRLWDEETERIRTGLPGGFWDRRVWKTIEGLRVPVLDTADSAAYACLHLLRHLLRGSVRVYHVYELSHFLNGASADAAVPEPRLPVAVCFRLAADWFGCETPRGCTLPDPVEQWFERYCASPVEAMFHPNKDEIWLHLALVDSTRDKAVVLRRRLFPASLPGPVDSVYVPERDMTWRLRVRKTIKYAGHIGARFLYHAGVLPRVLGQALSGPRWVLGRPYWTFLAAALLYEFGMFVFVLLYNLFLLDRGHGEKTLGAVASAFAAGGIAGTLPAGSLGSRLGLRKTLVLSFLAVAAVSALRSIADARPLLVGLAFAGGAVASVFPVSIAPAIARLTSEARRPLGFSLFFGSGIALGIVAGLAGGRLPELFSWLRPVQAKQAALLAGCGIMAAAVLPAARIAFGEPVPGSRRSYPRGPFIVRFLAVIAVWNFATGLFNPFFNAYFSRLGVPVPRIGTIFSGSQLAQVVAILAAPLVFRRTGLAMGIAAMQAATALALAGLAAGTTQTAAALTYAAYTAFQYMSEPGIYSLLMDRIQPTEHSGASAMQFFVSSSVQALAAAAAGIGLARLGYPPVLAGAAALAIAASLLSRTLLTGARNQ